MVDVLRIVIMLESVNMFEEGGNVGVHEYVDVIYNHEHKGLLVHIDVYMTYLL